MSASNPLSFVDLPSVTTNYSESAGRRESVSQTELQTNDTLPKSPERAFTADTFKVNTRHDSDAFTPLSSGLQTPVTPMHGSATPDPLLGHNNHAKMNREALLKALSREHTREQSDAQSSLGSTSNTNQSLDHTTDVPLEPFEVGSPTHPVSQGVPPELGNFFREIVFVLVCTTGQLLFAILLGNCTSTQFAFRDALGIGSSELPWLVGALMLANGLSVVVSGSLADLTPPRGLIVGAFIWLTMWHIIGAFSISPGRKILFFIVRAMQGMSIGVLVSGTISVLGRVYNPGIRKNRVFSMMAAGAPFGFWVGNLQGGAFAKSLPWIFGSSAILTGICAIASWFSIPSLRPAKDSDTSGEAPSMRNFDYAGALTSSVGCGLLLFGLTQGSSTGWAPYTYTLVIVGILTLIAFPFVERRVARPLIPNVLWKTPGFAALLVSYFLGYGSYVGAWQFFAVQFWLRFQNASPLKVALYITPNAVIGVLATWIISRTMHLIPGHWILTASMIAYALGPTFFLPQTPNTPYWALSMLGTGLASFGPDLSFAAASIFITSSVQRSYQGSAGSLLVTIQNLSAAIMTAVSDSIGVKVDSTDDGDIGLQGIKAIWWFALGLALCGSVITAIWVRIDKTAEKEHVS